MTTNDFEKIGLIVYFISWVIMILWFLSGSGKSDDKRPLIPYWLWSSAFLIWFFGSVAIAAIFLHEKGLI